MQPNYYDLIRRYVTDYDGDKVTYQDSSGAYHQRTKPWFQSISSAFQSRGHISRPELRDIGRWKLGSNQIDRWLKSNPANDVRTYSAAAFNAKTDTEAIDALTNLTGIRVPVASAILAMYDPDQYAVMDFRTFRAIGRIRPALVNPRNYSVYTRFTESLLNHRSESEAYRFYMDEVRKIANKEGFSPREIDMALSALDKSF